MKPTATLMIVFGFVSHLTASQCSLKKYERLERLAEQKSHEKLLEQGQQLRKTIECAKKKELERAKQSATMTQEILTESYLVSDLAKICAEYLF